MTQVSAAFTRDANNVPITTYGLTASKSITYAALTTGAVGATTLFTVTGTVRINIFAVCSADLTGSGTIEVGISGNTAALIAQTTGTAIDAGEVWVDNAPATVEAPITDKILTAGTDIIQTIGTDTLTGGTLTYYVTWAPISTDGDVTAA